MMMSRIDDYLDQLFPEPKCELIYHNDYELLIAIVLSAQSTDKRVNQVTPILFSKFSSLKDLMNASLADLEAILYPVGSFHKKASYVRDIATILVNDYNCIVPRDREALMKFPGVGRKTINVFLSEYYGEAAIAVDTHVERVSKRLGLASSLDNVLMIEEKLMRYFSQDVWGKRHLQLVLFGRYYCKAVKPQCSSCLLKDICLEKNKNL